MSRKFLITLILILFILPFVSWYYLQRGLDWRKEAQEVMKGADLFPEGEWVDMKGAQFSSTQLEEHVTLVTRVNCGQKAIIASTLHQFYEQFKETGKANFVILDACHAMDTLSDPARKKWYIFSCSDSISLCSLLSASWPEGMSYALVDKRKTIRSYYPGNTEDEKRTLLEHMALLLPRERSDKIELKRGNKE